MRFPIAIAICLLALAANSAEPPDWSKSLPVWMEQALSIGREGKNSVEAARAARQLGTLPPDALFPILEGFGDTNPLAANLLRSSVLSIADRAAKSNTPLPNDRLVAMLVKPGNWDPRARRLAYDLLKRSDPSAAKELLPLLIADPSPELRRESVAYWIAEADRLKAAEQTDEARAAFQKALGGAIDDDQVKPIVAALKGYGVEVDLPRHFGFVTHWQALGPFDNREMKGFDVAYPPEEAIDLVARYDGKLGEVKWLPITSDNDYGIVDVAKTFANEKGSVTYLVTTFRSEKTQPVEFRIGTQNAWKLWLNGEFLFGREEYHRGMQMDQYRIPAKLQAGENVLLMKLLQNEQPEDWAQDYKFQLRVTDPTGRALLPLGTAASESGE